MLIPTSKPRRARGAFSLLEFLFTTLILGILLVMFLPALDKTRMRARRAQCVNNLAQLGAAFHAFAHEHDSLFPMQVSTNAGGTLEFMQRPTNSFDNPHRYRTFQALQIDWALPKQLVCPMDNRLPAADFKELQNTNISYFIASSAEYGKQDSLLAGDRNLARANSPYPLSLIGPDIEVEWTAQTP